LAKKAKDKPDDDKCGAKGAVALGTSKQSPRYGGAVQMARAFAAEDQTLVECPGLLLRTLLLVPWVLLFPSDHPNQD
jgi:hypothetical protein